MPDYKNDLGARLTEEAAAARLHASSMFRESIALPHCSEHATVPAAQEEPEALAMPRLTKPRRLSIIRTHAFDDSVVIDNKWCIDMKSIGSRITLLGFESLLCH